MVRRSSVDDLIYAQPRMRRDEELILLMIWADGILRNIFPAGENHTVGWNPPSLLCGIKRRIN